MSELDTGHNYPRPERDLNSELQLPRSFERVDFITENIAVGPAARLTKELVVSNGFCSILSLSDVPENHDLLDLKRDGVQLKFWERVLLVDGQENSYSKFERAVNLLADLVEDGPVFVHCHAGLSRSPAVVVAQLAVAIENGSDDQAIAQAFELVRAKRPEIDINSFLFHQLERYVYENRM